MSGLNAAEDAEMGHLLGSLERGVIVLFLIVVMLSLGLELKIRDCLSALHDKRLIAGALVANFVVVPLLGLGITRILPMPSGIERGFLLLAAAPGALFAVNFTRQMRGSTPVAAALLFLLTVLSILITPLLAQGLMRADQIMLLPYDRVLRVLPLYVLAPMLVGLALARWYSPFARRMQDPTSKCAGVLFILAAVLTMSVKSQATRRIGTNGLLALALLIVGSMVVGWLLGGPDKGSRRVLALNTCMRNVALCLAIASRSLVNSDAEVAILAGSALMVPAAFLFTMYHSRKLRHQTTPGARSSPSKRDAA